ncbi:SRPBCC family protein [Flavobacterium sp. ARAG 55.4]|uniref:SRPBCC family protein n=1 Tax=Flavobacterium sp. ARAG 55.4 TaxID=3451357 RepID=UPI003F464D59
METRTQSSASMKAHKPMIKNNVSTLERIIMVTSGAYLLYNGLAQKEKNLTKSSLGGSMLLRGISGYCPVYDAVDHLKNGKAHNVNIRLSSTINKPVSEVYAFWRNLENLPKFMNHLESVKTINSTISEWTAKGPAGIGSLSWKAEIIKDEKEKLLSWHSLHDASIENAGKVVFKPKGKGTELDITISYHAPLGIAGEKAARLLNPFFEKMVRDDVQNLKCYLESGHN